MTTLTVTTKGQITLRKELLQHLGVAPGEKIAIDKLPNGEMKLRADRPTGDISEVFNLFDRRNGPHLTIEQINEVAAKGWAGKL